VHKTVGVTVEESMEFYCLHFSQCSIYCICGGFVNSVFFLQKFGKLYDKEKESQGRPSDEIQFAYAWCLVRSRQTADLRLGTQLLEGNASSL